MVITALHQMIDVTTSRASAALTYTPILIMVRLSVLGLACSLLVGYMIAGSQTRQVGLHMLSFALMMTTTIYPIIDLDFPRFKLIRLDFADQGLLDLLGRMK